MKENVAEFEEKVQHPYAGFDQDEGNDDGENSSDQDDFEIVDKISKITKTISQRIQSGSVFTNDN